MLSWWQPCNLSDVNALCFVVALSKELHRAHDYQPYYARTRPDKRMQAEHTHLHTVGTHTQTYTARYAYRFTEGSKE